VRTTDCWSHPKSPTTEAGDIVLSKNECGRRNGEDATLARWDEGRKRVLLIAASILAARKLAQYEGGKRVPATISAIADAIRWAEQIMQEIDHR
jgi:hypothetical protein